MTVAICFACGEFKVGAFTPCPACGTEPTTDDDLAHSLALTDHYLTPEGLAQVQQQALAGQPINIDPDFYDSLLKPFGKSARPRLAARGGNSGKDLFVTFLPGRWPGFQSLFQSET